MLRWEKVNKKIDEDNKVKPLQFEWKEKLKDDILYNKFIVKVLENEWDRRLVEDNGKWKEQFERNLAYYKWEVEKLNKIRQKENLLALQKRNDWK